METGGGISSYMRTDQKLLCIHTCQGCAVGRRANAYSMVRRTTWPIALAILRMSTMPRLVSMVDGVVMEDGEVDISISGPTQLPSWLWLMSSVR